MSEFEKLLRHMIEVQNRKCNDANKLECVAGDTLYRVLYEDEIKGTLNKLQYLMKEYRQENNYPGCTCCHTEEEDDLK